MMLLTRVERRTVLWLALAYAVVSTGVWAGLFATRSGSDGAFAVAHFRMIVNFGGDYLSSVARWFLLGVPPDDMSRMDSAEWALYWGADFIGALLQGLGYAVLGLAFVRRWRQGRARALAGAIVAAVVLAASYKVGTFFYERANCITTVHHFADGTETVGECGASIFGSGLMWMTVTFAVVVVLVALLEMRHRRTQVSAARK